MTQQKDLNGDTVTENEHEYCLRCGRRLKNVDARKFGYGKVCAEKLRTEIKRPLFKK